MTILITGSFKPTNFGLTCNLINDFVESKWSLDDSVSSNVETDLGVKEVINKFLDNRIIMRGNVSLTISKNGTLHTVIYRTLGHEGNVVIIDFNENNVSFSICNELAYELRNSEFFMLINFESIIKNLTETSVTGQIINPVKDKDYFTIVEQHHTKDFNRRAFLESTKLWLKRIFATSQGIISLVDLIIANVARSYDNSRHLTPVYLNPKIFKSIRKDQEYRTFKFQGEVINLLEVIGVIKLTYPDIEDILDTYIDKVNELNKMKVKLNEDYNALQNQLNSQLKRD